MKDLPIVSSSIGSLTTHSTHGRATNDTDDGLGGLWGRE
jgi:hypothetical protein